MNQIVAFDFESHDVRVVIGQDGEPRFVAADLLSTLSLDRKALERLDDDEKGVSSIHTPGGQQEMTVVNESGLFNLVLGSRKPEAKRFKRWVTHEVLPSIRKTGSYAVPGSVAALPAPTQDRVTALLMIGEAVAKVPGVKQGIAMVYDEIHMVLAQGNFVLAVSEGTFGGAPTSYYDLWRVENGKIAEHWDVMETIADEATWQNQNGKF